MSTTVNPLNHSSRKAVWLSVLWCLGAWLRGDAPQSRWAFEPIRPTTPPAVREVSWVQTPIDRFVLARLESRGWRPATPADRRTWIRRATFDLIGLPPTPEEIQAFVADTNPGAFDRVVDRLLSSPRHGERWARHWLDVARYADNKGYTFFEERSYPWAWTYRDYVVRSFNEDKPYSQFLLEQLAADQLDSRSDSRTLAALGFITVGDHFSNNTHDILDDRIDVVTRGVLGLTVGCARCHDHKYDPVTQADYYALYGVFRSATEPMVPPLLEEPERTNPYECFAWELSERERRLREYVEAKHSTIVREARERIADYLMAVHAQRGQPTTESFMLLADRGDLNPTVISRWRRHIERSGPNHPVWSLWDAVSRHDDGASASSLSNTVAQWLASSSPVPNPRLARAMAARPIQTIRDVADRYSEVLRAVDSEWGTLQRQTRAQASQPPARMASAADEELRRVLYGVDAPPDIPLQLDWGFLSLLPDRASQGEFQTLLKDLEQWLMNGPGAPPRAMVLTDLPVAHEPRVFERGNPNRLGKAVPRRFLEVLQGREFHQGSGRLELAQSLVDPANPFTARVIVNRVWLHHFGVGLVTTPSDFGQRSDPPSHPELLDWLADDFMRHGWSLKRLHRQILLSAVYQQSSTAKEPVATSTSPADPENRLLWRMNRRRHDFETQRDSLLAVAARLDPRFGGPPDAPESSTRRTLYSFINRLDLPPVMSTFDFPSPSSSCPQRSFTTVPSQALFLMNHSFTSECAAGVLRREDIATRTDNFDRIRRVYEVMYGRSPTERERTRAMEFLGTAPEPRQWEHWIQALLLANEFVFVD